MKIYLAGRFSRRHLLHELGVHLQKYGHEVVSRWTLPSNRYVAPAGLSELASAEERRRFAEEDLLDINACDWFVSFQEEPRGTGRGGRHVEFGYAWACGKEMFIIGPKETVFHALDGIQCFVELKDFAAWIVGRKMDAKVSE